MLFRIAASVLVILCIVATLFMMMGEDADNQQQPAQPQNHSITPQGNKNFNF